MMTKEMMLFMGKAQLTIIALNLVNPNKQQNIGKNTEQCMTIETINLTTQNNPDNMLQHINAIFNTLTYSTATLTFLTLATTNNLRRIMPVDPSAEVANNEPNNKTKNTTNKVLASLTLVSFLLMQFARAFQKDSYTGGKNIEQTTIAIALILLAKLAPEIAKTVISMATVRGEQKSLYYR